MSGSLMAEKFLAQAVQLFQAGAVDRASPFLRQAIATDPGCHQAHYLLGVLAQQSGRLPTAEDHFLAALDISPSDGGYLAALATVLLQQGRLADAALQVCTALAYAPGDATVLELAGDISFHSGNGQAAILHYRSAVSAGADPARMSRKIERVEETPTEEHGPDRSAAYDTLLSRGEALGIGKIIDQSPIAAVFMAESLEELSAAGDRWQRRENMSVNRPAAVVSPASREARERFVDLNVRLDAYWWQQDDLRAEKL